MPCGLSRSGSKVKVIGHKKQIAYVVSATLSKGLLVNVSSFRIFRWHFRFSHSPPVSFSCRIMQTILRLGFQTSIANDMMQCTALLKSVRELFYIGLQVSLKPQRTAGDSRSYRRLPLV